MDESTHDYGYREAAVDVERTLMMVDSGVGDGQKAQNSKDEVSFLSYILIQCLFALLGSQSVKKLEVIA